MSCFCRSRKNLPLNLVRFPYFALCLSLERWSGGLWRWRGGGRASVTDYGQQWSAPVGDGAMVSVTAGGGQAGGDEDG